MMGDSLLSVRGRGASYSLLIDKWNAEEKEEQMGGKYYAESSQKSCRVMQYSNNGKFFVFCNGERTIVIDTTTVKEIQRFEMPKTIGICFSPDDSILCTMEPFFTNKDNPEGRNNLVFWDTKTWDRAAEFMQKKQSSWQPTWTGDSKICGRLMTNNVFFYVDNNYEKVAEKLHVDKIESFSISPTKAPPHRVACFVRGAKGAPSSVKIYNYPNFSRDELLASKSFFKADSVTILWNSKGNAILIRAATDVDTTGASYYGEQSLHYMNCNGDTSIVQLPKKGPIYDAAWDPDSTRFCATYGFMPAKSSIFNHKCNIIHDFGPSPKNMCIYNPHGNLLILAGFGNLRGNIEVWHNGDKEAKLIAELEAPDTTQLEWCADGEHFVTATTAPRLRVNNGYKIWHYTGGVPLIDRKWANELHEVRWQTYPPEAFKPPKIVSGPQPTKSVGASKPQSYIPPHARGRADYSASKFKMEDEEKEEQNLSKSAMKNKKKREAKKKQTQQPASDLSSSQQDAVAMAKYLLAGQGQSSTPVANDNEKKIKNLKKKIQTIEKLITQQKEGKKLEKNQIDKISTLDDLISQLKELEMK